MNMKIFFLIVTTVHFLVLSVFCQDTDLYIPKNIKAAYAKQTRLISGEPGPEYWQNRADYDITVELDPATGRLTGSEQIVYANSSPDTLNELIIHVFANLYKRGTAREHNVDPADESDGVFIDHISVNDQKIDVSVTSEQITYIHNDFRLKLPEPIAPGQKAEIKMGWYYTINTGSPIRTGKVDETTFFFAYFFPRVAVYDDVDGWNELKYAGRSEFYNDFGDFQVSISVPENYLVWASGSLQNPEQVLNEKYLARLNRAMKSDSIIKIVAIEDLGQSITKSANRNIWKFRAENVNDFAFGTSDHYLWDGSSLITDPSAGRRVFIDAAYDKSSKDFYEVAQIARDAINFMSTEMPGVPFPYPCETVFNGQEEMEYPMMVNDMSVQDRSYLIKLTSHEIFHSYFPFYMGINETKYAWMDEGWASFGDYLICKKLDPNNRAYFFYSDSYINDIGTDKDLPMISNSINLKEPTYHYNSYVKPATFLYILYDVLGDFQFKKIIHTYMNNWNGKHPMPYDFFSSLNNAGLQNLNWLIQPWFFEFGYVDLAITGVQTLPGTYLIQVDRKGNYPAPVVLELVFTDESKEIVRQDASVWRDGKERLIVKISSGKSLKEIQTENGTGDRR